MWVAISVPLVIGAIDGSVPASAVCPPLVDVAKAQALGLAACGSVGRALPRHRSVSR
jgi:hypothetical protein